MQLYGVLLGSVAALLAIALFARVRLALELSARGDPDGSWVAAFGAELGPVAFTAVAARGVAAKLELHAFGGRTALPRFTKKAPPPAERAAPPSSLGERLDAAADWLGFALEERRRLRLEELRVDVGFGFRDIALTGKILGALYALSGMLPPQVTLNQNPRWDGGESWDLGARGSVALWPGLVLAEVLWYMLRRAARRRSPRARAVRPAAP